LAGGDSGQLQAMDQFHVADERDKANRGDNCKSPSIL